ncbi:MAG: hypothetical protein OEZ39_08355 [Gammaproteobacteria bacterium]|nr:hypothetical protein [Gammaproteobacteria bacterium]MDH5651873.1 hypothetical protein [Gammaproteobacteria bacterium]
MNHEPDLAPQTDNNQSVRRFFALLLMISGVFIVAAAGLCSLVFVAGSAIPVDGLWLVLIVGGIPAVIGLLLYKGGKILKEKNNTRQPPTT